MRTVIATTLTLLVVVLTGCATTEAQWIAKQYDEHVYGVWNAYRA